MIFNSPQFVIFLAIVFFGFLEVWGEGFIVNSKKKSLISNKSEPPYVFKEKKNKVKKQIEIIEKEEKREEKALSPPEMR